jgi:hypothetical protein
MVVREPRFRSTEPLAESVVTPETAATVEQPVRLVPVPVEPTAQAATAVTPVSPAMVAPVAWASRA